MKLIRCVIIVLAAFIFICSCTTEDNCSKKINWFMYRFSADSNGINEQIDTLTDWDGSVDTSYYRLCGRDSIYYNGTKHILSIYDNKAPVVCSGITLYCLDTLGMIYSRNRVWEQFYSRRFSDNDSINDLIGHTMAHILAHQRLRNHGPVQELVRVSDFFVLPKIKKVRKKKSVHDTVSN